MRSATVGYLQTVVIMAAVKRADTEGRMDASHQQAGAHTHTWATLTAHCRQSDDLADSQRDGNVTLLTENEELDLQPFSDQLIAHSKDRGRTNHVSINPAKAKLMGGGGLQDDRE